MSLDDENNQLQEQDELETVEKSKSDAALASADFENLQKNSDNNYKRGDGDVERPTTEGVSFGFDL